MIFDRNAEHLGRHDAGQRLGQISQHLQAAFHLYILQKVSHDIADVRPEHLHPPRRKSRSRQSADACMRRRIQKQHLLDHDLSDRIQC